MVYTRNASFPFKPATHISIQICHSVKNPLNKSVFGGSGHHGRTPTVNSFSFGACLILASSS